jgi:putative tributyrin esterase
VTLLHGVYGSHWAWAVKGGAHRTLQRLVSAGEIPPMALAMPSDGLWGDGSGYVPHETRNFEKWIVEEVPAAAVAAMHCVSPESALFIAGLSMGGFGALRLGAKYPERYRAISGHSSVTHFEQLKKYVEEDLGRIAPNREDHSVLETMLRNHAALPPIRFDCGTEDHLLEHNRELHRQLEANGVAHCYEEFPGGHDWAYWEKHLEETLRFFGGLISG